MANLKVKSVSYNGHQTGSLENGLDFYCDYAEKGKEEHPTKRKVVHISEFTPSNGLGQSNQQVPFVFIHYEDGGSKKIFNLTEVEYYKPN